MLLSVAQQAQQFGTSLQEIARWRRKLNTPEAFEVTYKEVCAKYLAILEFESMAHVGQNTGNSEWFTPSELIECARRVLGGIDLDPASTAEANKVVKATLFYTRLDDGLSKPWSGRVWLNPPYTQALVSEFCKRLAEHFSTGAVLAAVVLVNNATETGWFQWVSGVADAFCFPHGRIQFWHPTKTKAAPLQGQAILYCGPDRDRFVKEFADVGTVLVKP